MTIATYSASQWPCHEFVGSTCIARGKKKGEKGIEKTMPMRTESSSMESRVTGPSSAISNEQTENGTLFTDFFASAAHQQQTYVHLHLKSTRRCPSGYKFHKRRHGQLCLHCTSCGWHRRPSRGFYRAAFRAELFSNPGAQQHPRRARNSIGTQHGIIRHWPRNTKHWDYSMKY